MELVVLPPEEAALFDSALIAKNRRRKFALFVLSGILSVVVFFQYHKGDLAFGVTGRNEAAVDSYAAPAPVRSEITPDPVPSPQPRESPSSSPSKSPASATPVQAVPKEPHYIKPAPAVSVEVKRAPARNTSTASAPDSKVKPPQKEESVNSKVTSIIKKTGNVLKRPFKF
jgi:hypothetical protein